MRIAARLVIAFLLCTAVSASQPNWIMIQDDNFRVYSSASERETRDMLNQFELIQGFFNQLTGTKPGKSEPVSVVIFGTEKEYQPYRFNSFASAYYSNHSDRDFIVVGKLGEQSSLTASHEYTHLAFAHAGYSLPPWLNEGIAELFSTLHPQGQFTLYGDVLPGRLQELYRDPWVPLATILAADRNSPYYNESSKAGSFYTESWALVHMLATSDEYRSKFWDVVKAINAGANSVEALEKVFGMPLAKLDDTLQSYVRGSRFFQLKVKVALQGAEKRASQPADMFEVRELQAAVHPRLRVGRQPVGVQLARAQHHLPVLAIDRVPVDVDVQELEQRPDRLQLLQRRPQRLRIPQPHVVDRVLVRRDLLVGRLQRRRELLLVDLLQPVRVARHVDVALQVRLLLRRLVRLHDEVLHD